MIHLPLLLILLTPLATQSNRIDATLSSLLQDARVTGAGIAVFHQGKIEFIKTYGWRDTERHLPLTPDSIMTAASLTKSAFATVVMRLAERHTIDLDKPIYRYLPKPLPEYPSYADLKSDDRYKKLTLRILLSHTSGFPNWRAFEDDRKLKIHFDPGTRYAYSGEGIDLAQLVIETVTGKPLTRLMQDELYAPVQMTRTSMVSEPRFENNFANGYDEYGRSLGPEKRSTPNAAGSLQTTLRDYATCLSALLRGKILNPQTAREMLAPQSSFTRFTSSHLSAPPPQRPTTISNSATVSAGDYISAPKDQPSSKTARRRLAPSRPPVPIRRRHPNHDQQFQRRRHLQAAHRFGHGPDLVPVRLGRVHTL